MSIEVDADVLHRALFDGIITPDETKELKHLRDKILADGSNVAGKLVNR